MSNVESQPGADNHTGNDARTGDDAELFQYRAVSGLAIVSAVLGVLAATALTSLVLWGIPLAGAVTSIVALVQINRSAGALSGRKAALAGLASSVFFGTLAPAHYLSTQRLLSERAAQVGRQWFDALAHDEPQVAHQLGLAAMARARLSDPAQLWNYYRNVAEKRRELERFVSEPLVHTLLALDGHAQVRLYDTPMIGIGDLQTMVTQVYAVTFEEAGQRKTFFVALSLERSLQRGSDKVDWRVNKYTGGIDPQ